MPPADLLLPVRPIDAVALAPFGGLLEAPSPPPRQDRATALET